MITRDEAKKAIDCLAIEFLGEEASPDTRAVLVVVMENAFVAEFKKSDRYTALPKRPGDQRVIEERAPRRPHEHLMKFRQCIGAAREAGMVHLARMQKTEKKRPYR